MRRYFENGQIMRAWATTNHRYISACAINTARIVFFGEFDIVKGTDYEALYFFYTLCYYTTCHVATWLFTR